MIAVLAGIHQDHPVQSNALTSLTSSFQRSMCHNNIIGSRNTYIQKRYVTSHKTKPKGNEQTTSPPV